MCNFKPDTLPRLTGVFPALVIAGLVLAFELSVINPLRAAEIIHDYDVTVEIAPSGELTVTEKVRVSAEGDQIKRGIYRDFPMMFEDGSGKERRVGFSLLSVTRDGKAEPHFTQSGPRMVRIYAGDEDAYLDFGVYEYVFRYRSDRQIRFFDDHDELSWNATGNGWVFPIERASALVILPPGVQSSGEVAYTGSFGSTQSNARAEVRKDGAEIYFQTTTPLSAYEGLTVGVRMPKGSIAGPDGATRAAWFWRDFAGHIIALMTLAIAFWYYLWAWLRLAVIRPRASSCRNGTRRQMCHRHWPITSSTRGSAAIRGGRFPLPSSTSPLKDGLAFPGWIQILPSTPNALKQAPACRLVNG